jgi:hypothetical protein
VPVAELVDDIGLDPATFEKVAHRGDVSELRYEVMYFCDLPDERIDDFKNGWGEIGDSIVVVGGDGTWNCHVHTDDIGAAIEVALELGGRPSKIRVTDLFGEVDEEHARREAAMLARSHAGTAGLPAVTTAVVAVTLGQGLIELFGQLGVQGLVTGGQTMNPSTAELLDAVEAVNAPQVVLLPNNKNIIPVAEQVRPHVDGGRRATKGITEVRGALAYDPEASGKARRTPGDDGCRESSLARSPGGARPSLRRRSTTGDWPPRPRRDPPSARPAGAAWVSLPDALHPRDRHAHRGGGPRRRHPPITEWLTEHRPRPPRGPPRGPAPLPLPPRHRVVRGEAAGLSPTPRSPSSRGWDPRSEGADADDAPSSTS